MSEEDEIRREECRMDGGRKVPVKTWWLYTKDGRHIYVDPNSAKPEDGATLESGGNLKEFEFTEGGHPDDDKNALTKRSAQS